MAVTQQDIARRLGVSQRLVSYALNGHACVGDEMRRRILEEAEELGYRPHRAAQALVTGRTYQIALCLPLFGSSFNNEIIRQFEMLANPTPYDLLMVTFDPLHKASGNIQFAADGSIFVGTCFKVPQNMVRPVVVLQNQLRFEVEEDPGVDRIQLNIEEASFAAMRHLLSEGRRRIAYVAHEAMMTDFDYRYVAYATCMEEADLPYEFISLPIPGEELIRQQAHQTMKAYFEKNGFPDAIFCCNDDIGMGAYRALSDLGRGIPETAIIGFDDLDYARYMEPPMTSVHMPIEEACRRAWELLMQRVEKVEFAPLHEEFAARLMVRESSLAADALAVGLNGNG